jgi:hypothetical protein
MVGWARDSMRSAHSFSAGKLDILSIIGSIAAGNLSGKSRPDPAGIAA